MNLSFDWKIIQRSTFLMEIATPNYCKAEKIKPANDLLDAKSLSAAITDSHTRLVLHLYQWWEKQNQKV